MADAGSAWSTSIEPFLMTSVRFTGASVTTRESPSSWIAATRPVAMLVSTITDPTWSLSAPGAFLSIVQTSPLPLAERIAAGPPPTTTTPGW